MSGNGCLVHLMDVRDNRTDMETAVSVTGSPLPIGVTITVPPATGKNALVTLVRGLVGRRRTVKRGLDATR
jgi:hypothetical protein